MPDPQDPYAPNTPPKASGKLSVHMVPVFALHAVKARRVVSMTDDVVEVRILVEQLGNEGLSPLRAHLYLVD